MPPQPDIPQPGGFAGFLLTMSVAFGALKNTETATAFQIIVLRTAICAVITLFIFIAMMLNLNGDKNTLRMLNWWFVGFSAALVFNLAHVRTMTTLYKLCNTLFFVGEVIIFMFFACFYFIFSILYYVTHPLQFLENMAEIFVAFFLVVTSYHYYVTIMGTSNGTLDTHIKLL